MTNRQLSLLKKPIRINEPDIIQIPYLPFVECIPYDEIPTSTTVIEALQIISECEYILQDITWQIRQKEANHAFDEIQYIDDQEKLIKHRLQFYNWISKVSSVARSTGARRFIYSEALRRAGKYEAK